MLRTERLLIRPWTAADLDDALALWGDPQVMALLGGVLSPAEIEARLAREIASQEQHGLQYWRLSAGEAFVGCCGLKHSLLEDGSTVVELGFHLTPSQWGQGYASEAARAAVDHAFETLRAPEVFAGHHPENHASRSVITKLRFTRVGTRFWAPTGLMHPWYSLRSP